MGLQNLADRKTSRAMVARSHAAEYNPSASISTTSIRDPVSLEASSCTLVSGAGAIAPKLAPPNEDEVRIAKDLLETAKLPDFPGKAIAMQVLSDHLTALRSES